MSFHRTRLESWVEWKEQCAIRSCSEEAREDLAAYGGPIVRNQIRKRQEYLNAPDLALPAEGGDLAGYWHVFESYMHVSSAKTGKIWKDWLFESAEMSASDAISVSLEKMTARCIRTAVFAYFRNEGDLKPKKEGVYLKSLEEPKPISGVSEESMVTEGDLIPAAYWNPRSEVEVREFEEIARQEADATFQTLNFERRMIHLAEALGLPIYSPLVLSTAGIGRDSAYRFRNEGLADLRRTFLAYADGASEAEFAPSLRLLLLFAGEALQDAAKIWGKSEKRAMPLFLSADTQPSAPTL